MAVKCLKKQLAWNDDTAGIRWINSDLIGFTYKMKNIKEETARQRRMILKVYLKTRF